MYRPWHSYYPGNVPIEIELPEMSIYQLLEHTVEEYPAYTAIIDGETEITYEQLKDASDQFAAALYRRGFQKGDRIGVMLPNCKEYVIAYFAIQRLGGVHVQVNPMYQPNELDYMLRDSEAAWFICREEQKQKVDQIGFTDTITIIQADGDTKQPDSMYHWIAEGNTELPRLEINPKEDVALLQYTGGTTGRSKGVMITHYNLVSNLHQLFLFNGGVLQRPGERLLGMMPVFHGAGMSRMVQSVFMAGTYIAVERFEVNKVLELFRKHRPTWFGGSPTMYIAFLRHENFDPADFSNLKTCGCGAAPMPIEVITEWEQKVGVRINEGYGLSEATSSALRNPITGLSKVGSVGFPTLNTDAKIVDVETGTREMLVGEAGELIVKGPQVMKGYWKKPEETQLTIRDGWLYTGDMATMDEDGYFYIVGRKKEMIIAGGYNIYPVEIEEALYQHPAVAEACVFGVPDSYRGETVKAAIVLKQNEHVTEENVSIWCNERLARYKVPRIIEFRDTLPKSDVGKILRRQLVEEEKMKSQAQNP